MENAAIPGQPLPHNHNRDGQPLQNPLMLRRKYCSNQNYAVHQLVLKRRQILHFLLGIILGDRQKHLITVLIQHGKHSFHHRPNGFGGHLRNNHSHHPGFLRPKRLRLHGRAIACFLHCLPYRPALFFRDITIVKIPGNSRTGYPCQFCDLCYIHLQCPPVFLACPHSDGRVPMRP